LRIILSTVHKVLTTLPGTIADIQQIVAINIVIINDGMSEQLTGTGWGRKGQDG
jgi:hypothetical protein